MKKIPPSLFLVSFECSAWRLCFSFDDAVREAKFGGTVCCDRASERRPHGSTITEYTRAAEAATAKRRQITDLEKLREISGGTKLHAAPRKPSGRKGGLVVIDGGRAK